MLKQTKFPSDGVKVEEIPQEIAVRQEAILSLMGTLCYRALDSVVS